MKKEMNLKETLELKKEELNQVLQIVDDLENQNKSMLNYSWYLDEDGNPNEECNRIITARTNIIKVLQDWVI